MPIAASNPTERAEQLIVLTERLTGLIEREVDLLNDRHPEGIADFVDERSTLSSIYSQEMQLIKRDKSLIAGITRDLKDALKHATEKFQAALATHALVVQRMKTVSEKIIKAVSDEVAKTRAPTLGYGKNATLNAAPTRAAMPIAVNQTA